MAPSRESVPPAVDVNLGPRTPARVRKRTGRPATAQKVWTRRNTANFVKLFYCTNLSREAIGLILSALAAENSREHQTALRSGRTSTYNQVKSLKLDDRARPKSWTATRARLSWLRLVQTLSGPQNRRAAKAFQVHGLSAYDIVDGNLDTVSQVATGSTSRPLPQTHGLDVSAQPNPSIGTSEASHRINGTRRERTYDLVRNSIWSLESRPPSSLLNAALSILSSPRSSILSKRSSRASGDRASLIRASTSSELPYDVPNYPQSGKVSDLTSLITLSCCQNRAECLHRKVWRMMAKNDFVAGGFVAADFQYNNGVDMFRNTAVHIAAEWSAPITVILELLIRSCNELLNVININHDTIVDILADRLILENPWALVEIIRAVDQKGFDWESYSMSKNNFFVVLLPKIVAEYDDLTSVGIVRSLETLLTIPQKALGLSLAHRTTSGELVADKILRFLDYRLAVWDTAINFFTLTTVRNEYFTIAHGYVKERLESTVFKTMRVQDRNRLFPLSHRFDTSSLVDTRIPLEEGWDPNHYTSLKRSFLMCVIFEAGRQHISEAEAIKYLGTFPPESLDLRLADLFGNTALHIAAYCGLEAVVKKLLALGAEPRAANSARHTPLDMCIHMHKDLRKSAIGPKYSTSMKVMVRLFDSISPRRASDRVSSILSEAMRLRNDNGDSNLGTLEENVELDTMQLRNDNSDNGVLWVAASLFEFDTAATKYEAGYPYLTYQAGEIFEVFAESGELLLARIKNDLTMRNQLGWIWSKHCTELGDPQS